jgi:AmmeMemoRadiSam system protein A
VSGGVLSDTARANLLLLARGALESHFRGGPPPRLSSDKAETFGEPRGLFVTLKKAGQLRGCIGTLSAAGDITRCVARYALLAALEDPRFSPLEERELSECSIEISVLGPPRPIERPEEIEIGRDGLILEMRGQSGLLLPQVAVEWGFDAERFLEEVARKAGLPEDASRHPDARVWAFQADVFSE